MKRFSVLILSLLLIPAFSGARTQPVGKIGLYIDEQHSTNEVETPGTFNVYVFCLPSSNGMKCAEYSVAFTPGLVAFNVTSHPDVSIEVGSLTGGMSVCFVDCRGDWVWTHQFSVLARTGDPAEIVLKRNPLTGGLVFANCFPGSPLENVIISSKICLNAFTPQTF